MTHDRTAGPACDRLDRTEAETMAELDGELSAAGLKSLREHVLACPRCRGIRDSLHAADRALRNAHRAEPSLPARFPTSRFLPAAVDAARRGRRARWYPLAAAALLLLALGAGLWQLRAPSPPVPGAPPPRPETAAAMPEARPAGAPGAPARPADAEATPIRLKSLVSRLTYDAGGGESVAPEGAALDLRGGFSVRTDARGKALVVYPDAAKILLLPNTEARVSAYALEIRRGDTWMRFTKRGADFKIRTPAVVLAIRGTTFKVSVDGSGSTTVSLLEGSVALATGETEFLLAPGRAARICAGTDAILPEPIDPALPREAETAFAALGAEAGDGGAPPATTPARPPAGTGGTPAGPEVPATGPDPERGAAPPPADVPAESPAADPGGVERDLFDRMRNGVPSPAPPGGGEGR